jgi:uncharacterized membrane protein
MAKRLKLIDLGLFAFGIAYPLLVFTLRGTVDSSVFVVMALAGLGLRFAWEGSDGGYWRPALLLSACAVGGLALLDATLASRAYPVVVSLAAAGVFAITLPQSPSLVEKLALACGESWSPHLRAYCRNVTAMWAIWLTINAMIAAGLAFAGNDNAWALWTGLISYLVSGILFATEWLVRRTVAKRQMRQ